MVLSDDATLIQLRYATGQSIATEVYGRLRKATLTLQCYTT